MNNEKSKLEVVITRITAGGINLIAAVVIMMAFLGVCGLVIGTLFLIFSSFLSVWGRIVVGVIAVLAVCYLAGWGLEPRKKGR